jgi:methylated-DNA-protein-cysteine methyltransferase-like protein
MKALVTRKPKTFSERVLEAALSIPPGKVTTYGRIARAAGGGPLASQSITNILSKAYDKGERSIPFHRIVYADGRIWIDDKHRAARMRLYKKEGIEIDKRDRIKDFRSKIFEPKKTALALGPRPPGF